jgi:hypothetical protein
MNNFSDICNKNKFMVSDNVKKKMQRDDKFSQFIINSWEKHKKCDWGCVAFGHVKHNIDAIKKGEEVFSKYFYGNIAICILSNNEISRVMFLEEYTSL